MADFEDSVPTDLPAEYIGSDIYGSFDDDDNILFSDAPVPDFRRAAVTETIRAIRAPAGFTGNRHPSAETASFPPAAESVRKTAREAARAALGLRAHEAPAPSAVLWVVRDCGVTFCDHTRAWREIRRPNEAGEPRRCSVSLRVPTGRGEPVCPSRLTQGARGALALCEIEVAADELCVLVPTSGLVAAWVWTEANKCYSLGAGRIDAAAVFPVSFPEAAALGLVDGIRLPFDGEPRGPGDILRTELLALPQIPEERVEAAARWLCGRLARSGSAGSRRRSAHDEARRVLGLGRRS